MAMPLENIKKDRRIFLGTLGGGVVGLIIGGVATTLIFHPSAETKTITTTYTETRTETVTVERKLTGVRKVTIKFGMLPGTEYAPLYYGITKGIYSKYGLEIEELNFASPVELVTALATGQIQFGFAPSAFWIAAYANQGLPIRILAGVGRGGYYYAVRKDSTIFTVKDWYGKRIGSRGATALITLAAMELLEKYEIDPKTGVEFVHFLGTPIEYLAALERGEVDVIGLWEPWAQVAKSRGHRLVTSYDEIWPHHPECVLVGNADFVSKNPDITVNLIRGYKESINSVYTEFADVCQFIGQKFNLNTQVVRFSLLSQPVNWRLNEEELETIVDLMLKYEVISKKVKVEEIADLSFLEEVKVEAIT